MTLTVTKDLPEVGLTGNPMILGLQTDNMFSAAGSKADIELLFTVIDTVAGHTITLSWNNLEITLELHDCAIARRIRLIEVQPNFEYRAISYIGQ